MEYASKLKGKILGEVCDEACFRFSSKNKGSFGNILESGYFMIDNNNEHEPDFEYLGIELKTTPLVKATKTDYRPKERMSLGNINYMTLLTEGIGGSLLHKNNELLVIFYLDAGESDIRNQKIVGSTLWKFPEDDMKIITEDWGVIADMVRRGLAHELSGRLTFYLEAAPKGPGRGRGMKPQPYSDVKAKPRAFALKPRYVSSIWKSTKSAERIVRDLSEWDGKKTFEMIVTGRFEPYIGMYFEELESIFGKFKDTDKGKFATMARLIMGIKGKRIEEFEKANVTMKIVRLKPNGRPKEDMSFPYFNHEDIIGETWERSDFHDVLDRKFLFVVYQMEHDGRTYLRTAKFWSMPMADMFQAEVVWTKTQRCLKNGEFKSLPKSSENRVAHVRPHARDKNDTYIGADGRLYEKKSFWLNSSYLKDVLAGLMNDDDK